MGNVDVVPLPEDAVHRDSVLEDDEAELHVMLRTLLEDDHVEHTPVPAGKIRVTNCTAQDRVSFVPHLLNAATIWSRVISRGILPMKSWLSADLVMDWRHGAGKDLLLLLLLPEKEEVLDETDEHGEDDEPSKDEEAVFLAANGLDLF